MIQLRERWTHLSLVPLQFLSFTFSLCMVFIFSSWHFQVASYHMHEAFFFKMASIHDYKQLQSVIFYCFHIICKKSIYTWNGPTWLQNCIKHYFLLSDRKKKKHQNTELLFQFKNFSCQRISIFNRNSFLTFLIFKFPMTDNRQ